MSSRAIPTQAEELPVSIQIIPINLSSIELITHGQFQIDYAVQIFHDALKTRQFQCYLKPDTRLPMMYITDALRWFLKIVNILNLILTEFVVYFRSLCEFMALPPEALKQRTYNVTAMSFTPEEIVRSVQR